MQRLLLLTFIHFGALTASNSTKYRLNYHITAATGWINDPNGLSYYNNHYHVFFQHNPDDTHAENIHWGHVTSTDLIHWQYLPEAISPDQPYDNAGCFSGSAVVDGDDLVLIYTGNNNGGGRNFSTQCQCVARSSDGVRFEKYEQNPVIAMPPDGGSADFRDPKVWKHADSWYMVAGNRIGDSGRVVIYKSPDLFDWEYVGVLAESVNGTLGYMWECPDFFQLDGKYVLLFNPQGIEPSGDDYRNEFQTGYLVGTYDYETNVFEHGDFHELDHGTDFYATQTFLDPNGRRIMFAWMDMWGADFKEADEGWAGALTLPRVLKLNEDDRLMNFPVPETMSSRGETYFKEPALQVNDRYFLRQTNSAEMILKADLGTEATAVGFQLRDGGSVILNVYFDKVAGKLVLERGEDVRRAALQPQGQVLMHVFLDKSSIEVIASGGLCTMTARIYPEEIPTMFLFADGGSTVMDVTLFEVKSSYDDTESTIIPLD